MNGNRKGLLVIARLARVISWASVIPGIFFLLSALSYVIRIFFQSAGTGAAEDVNLWMQTITAILPASVIFKYAVYFILLKGMSAMIRQLLDLEERLKLKWKDNY